MTEEKPVVFVPAYNEAHNIGKLIANLSRLQKDGVIGKTLVIDDGSRDGTAELARKTADAKKMDLAMVRFPKNHGKAMAFYEATRYFSRQKPNPARMIMLDADIKEVSAEQVMELLAPLGREKEKTLSEGRLPKRTVGYKVGMVIGTNDWGIQMFSGQRAFAFRELKPILTRPSWRRMLLGTRRDRGGYGLETFLNYFFVKPVVRVDVAGTYFKSGPASFTSSRAGRSNSGENKMRSEMKSMRSKVYDRILDSMELRAKLRKLAGAERQEFIKEHLRNKKIAGFVERLGDMFSRPRPLKRTLRR